MSETDDLTLSPVARWLASVNDRGARFVEGDALPILWHWFYFLPQAMSADLDEDGAARAAHPPTDLPQRMFAGADVVVHAPLVLGGRARREARVSHAEEKTGRSGRLFFVTETVEVKQAERLCIEETRRFVYREPARGEAAAGEKAETGAWSRLWRPDPVMLFRFSALTFNSHRIHYDAPYAREVAHYPDLVVHGPLAAMAMAELLRAHVSKPIRRFRFQALRPLFAGRPFTVHGAPKDDGVFSVWIADAEGALAMRAEAAL
jgi:3-methylfumaryl-CoA hydratase